LFIAQEAITAGIKITNNDNNSLFMSEILSPS
jgi:hypothetical protein